jgi:hypothetical protein
MVMKRQRQLSVLAVMMIVAFAVSMTLATITVVCAGDYAQWLEWYERAKANYEKGIAFLEAGNEKRALSSFKAAKAAAERAITYAPENKEKNLASGIKTDSGIAIGNIK